jgi:hypothetical protein
MHRDHIQKRQIIRHEQIAEVNLGLACDLPFCIFTSSGTGNFLAHLRDHLCENVAMKCPYEKCDKVFAIKSSFTSHISRCHRGSNLKFMARVSQVQSADCNPIEFGNELLDRSSSSIACDADAHEEDDDTSSALYESQYIDNLALFYLKLQAKFLLPGSTIQSIVDEIQNIHDLDQTLQYKRLSQKLSVFGISDVDVTEIVDDLRNNNLFRKCMKGELRSHQTRQTFFKKRFKYVAPKQIYLGRDSCSVERYAQYIPIKDSITALFEDSSVRSMYTAVHSNKISQPRVFTDICDGKMFKSNEFFSANPTALRIILYQDAFEVVNPLGSARKKHKILAVYYSLADLLPHSRSVIDHIQLVLLAREADFKEFGHDKFFLH